MEFLKNSVDFERSRNNICALIRLNGQNKLTLYVSFCVFDPFPSFSGRFEFLFFFKERTEIQNAQKTMEMDQRHKGMVKWKTRSAECGVRSVENAECGKRGV